MTAFVQVVEGHVMNNNLSQDSSHPDDHFQYVAQFILFYYQTNDDQ